MINKTGSILIISLICLNHSYAQPPEPDKLFDYNENYFVSLNHGKLKNVPFLIAVIPNKIRIYRPDPSTYKQSNILDSLINDSNFRIKENRPNYRPVINLDSTKAMLFVQGINKKNANEYEFRVLENNTKQIVPWQPIIEFYSSTYVSGFGEDDSEMAYLGSFSTTWNNYLTVDVRKKGLDVIISSETILWLSHSPKVIATFKPNELNEYSCHGDPLFL